MALRGVVVVGGGISGLTAAWRLLVKRPGLEVTVLEAAQRSGGQVLTHVEGGALFEGAADGFLARKPPTLAWARELGLGGRLVEPRPEHRGSQIWWEGSLHPLPEGFSGLVPGDPGALARSSLLTPEGAARAALEPQVAPRKDGPEESVAEFLSRRYGSEAFQRLLEPLLAGIWAGDTDLLSADVVLPQLKALESAGTSLTAGLPRPDPSSGAAFRSFVAGMGELPAALARAVEAGGGRIVLGQKALSIEGGPGAWTVRTRDGVWAAGALICALGPRAAAPLLARTAPGASDLLASWPTASVAHVNLALDEGEVPHLPSGSGFVAPKAAGVPWTAATWSSRKWPHRTPEGLVSARIYFGGARDPEAWTRPEGELVDQALDLLARFHQGRRPRPRFHRVFRWKDAFAQAHRGHGERHRRLEAALPPGLVLAGGYFAGPGIPDCMARSERAADLVWNHLCSQESP